MSAEVYLTRPEIESVLPHKGESMFLQEATVQPGISATATLADIPSVIESGQKEIPHFVVLDALAQTLTLIEPPDENNIGLLAGIDNMVVHRKPLATEAVQLNAGNVHKRGPVGRGHVVARVGGEVLLEGDLIFAIANKSFLK